MMNKFARCGKDYWRFQDLTGQKFNNWTVIERDGITHPTRWLCRCDCGTVKSVLANCLPTNISRSCGCVTKPYSGKPNSVAAFNDLFSKYRRQATTRGVTFGLTKEQFAEFTKQNCHYCGGESMQVNDKGSPHGVYLYNGIDRVDNTRGYVINNCVSCCGICNNMKKHFLVNDFIAKVRQINRYYKEDK